MLPRRFRLKESKKFDNVYKYKLFVKNNFFTLYYLPKLKSTGSDFEIGFVVSKKIFKSAVKRNHNKRRLREAFRLLLTNENNFSEIVKQCDALVFVIKTDLSLLDFNFLTSAVDDSVKLVFERKNRINYLSNG